VTLDPIFLSWRGKQIRVRHDCETGRVAGAAWPSPRLTIRCPRLSICRSTPAADHRRAGRAGSDRI